MSSRPPVPAELERRLMVEVGHRCAIPTCRAIGPLEIEHIEDWARVRKHSFDNMIVLCANCHGRKGTRPGQIDRKSLRQYKANLAIVNARYGEMERRVLDYFAVLKPNWDRAQKAVAEAMEAIDLATASVAELSRTSPQWAGKIEGPPEPPEQ